MNKLDRRDLLKALALTSAIGATGCNPPAERPKEADTIMKTLAGPSNRLNVLVHGMAGAQIVDTGAQQRIRLLLPMVHGHEYAIGSFLKEDAILDRYHDYTLTVPPPGGTTTTKLAADPTQDAVIPSTTALPAKARNVIDMPWPNYPGTPLLRLRVIARGASRFFASGPDPISLPLLYVFSYAVDPSNPPVLTYVDTSGASPTTVRSNWTWSSTDNNLHIWCGPGPFGSGQSADNHFKEAVSSFQGMFASNPTLSAGQSVQNAKLPDDTSVIPCEQQLSMREYRQGGSCSTATPRTKGDDTSSCWVIFLP